jgi:hypothetical protein
LRQPMLKDASAAKLKAMAPLTFQRPCDRDFITGFVSSVMAW